jgi:predicted TIM-barrel fold metal-dependent hydrolase
VHDNVARSAFLDIARKDGFELLSINVDYPDFPPLPLQAQAAEAHRRQDPGRFHFATAFSMEGFGEPGWAERAIASIDAAVAKGAVAVKVWKNIGMVVKDKNGRNIFIDDPRFEPVIRHLEEIGLPLIAHQGEPLNCWLPLEQMTTENDRSYFRDHPQYHMYLHPEEPSYEMLMAARDRFVAFHPKLVFVGAHMASLEWSVDRLAGFLDRFPNANVDIAARMTQIQYQSVRDHKRVRDFFVKYQDRLLYGSDIADNPPDPGAPAQNPPTNPGNFEQEADRAWRSDWRYLATPNRQRIDDIDADVTGLALPRSVIDKIYYRNARRIFIDRKKA